MDTTESIYPGTLDSAEERYNVIDPGRRNRTFEELDEAIEHFNAASEEAKFIVKRESIFTKKANG